MSVAADRRRAFLTAALGFLHFAPVTPALVALHAWLDSWRGIGSGETPWRAVQQAAWAALKNAV